MNNNVVFKKVVIFTAALVFFQVSLQSAHAPAFGHYADPYQFFTVYGQTRIAEPLSYENAFQRLSPRAQAAYALFVLEQEAQNVENFFIQIIGSYDQVTQQRIPGPWNVCWHHWALGGRDGNIHVAMGLLGVDGADLAGVHPIAFEGFSNLRVHIHGDHYSPNNAQWQAEQGRSVIAFFPAAYELERAAFGMTLVLNNQALHNLISAFPRANRVGEFLLMAELFLLIAEGRAVRRDQFRGEGGSLIANFGYNDASTIALLNAAIQSITNDDDRRVLATFASDMVTLFLNLRLNDSMQERIAILLSRAESDLRRFEEVVPVAVVAQPVQPSVVRRQRPPVAPRRGASARRQPAAQVTTPTPAAQPAPQPTAPVQSANIEPDQCPFCYTTVVEFPQYFTYLSCGHGMHGQQVNDADNAEVCGGLGRLQPVLNYWVPSMVCPVCRAQIRAGESISLELLRVLVQLYDQENTIFDRTNMTEADRSNVNQAIQEARGNSFSRLVRLLFSLDAQRRSTLIAQARSINPDIQVPSQQEVLYREERERQERQQASDPEYQARLETFYEELERLSWEQYQRELAEIQAEQGMARRRAQPGRAGQTAEQRAARLAAQRAAAERRRAAGRQRR